MATEDTRTDDEEGRSEATFEERVQALREFDLEPVTERLRRRDDVRNADELEMKFRRFAKLLLEQPDVEFGLSEELDEYWHAFILDTIRYHRFCEVVFGGYLHHVPGDPLEVDPGEYAADIEAGSGHNHAGVRRSE